MSEAARPKPRAERLAWLIWAPAALSFGYAFFQRVAPSVMVEELMRDFAVSGAVLGNLSAIYFYVYAGLQIPIGMGLDRWGPRRMLTGGMLLAGAGSLLFAGADSLSLAYLGRLLVGLGSAVGFVGALKIAGQWFPASRFAFVSGLTMLVAMIGGVAGQAPLAAVVQAVGWRSALTGAGLFALLLAAVIWLLVRDRPPDNPSAERGAGSRKILSDLRQVLANPQNWVIALFGGLMTGPLLSYAGLWGVPHLMQLHGLERPAAAGSASLVMLGWALGAPASGWISDRIGRRRRPMALAAAVALVGWLLLLYVPGLPLVAAWPLLFLVGLASAAMVITFAAARELSPIGISGAVTGFVNMAAVGAGALLQPFLGWLLDLGWDGRTLDGARIYSLEGYALAFITLPACAALALLAASRMRETYCRQQA